MCRKGGERNKLKGIQGKNCELTVTRALEEYKGEGQLLSDTAVDYAVDTLRPTSRNNVFISESFASSYLALDR